VSILHTDRLLLHPFRLNGLLDGYPLWRATHGAMIAS